MNNSYVDKLVLKDLMYSKCTPNNRYAKVRHRAKAYFSIIPKNLQKCQVCNYEKHVQMCHKKPIASFSLDTKISSINNPTNLIMLCPNCHWELDNDMLDVSSLCISTRCVFPTGIRVSKINKKEYNTCLCGKRKTKEANVCMDCYKLNLKNKRLELKKVGLCNFPQSSRYTKICLDCGKKIFRTSRRCKSCAARILSVKKQKIEWPPTEKLIAMIEESSCVAVAKKLGVSDQAVYKRIKNHPAKKKETGRTI